jgi:hypothetical protein
MSVLARNQVVNVKVQALRQSTGQSKMTLVDWLADPQNVAKCK